MTDELAPTKGTYTGLFLVTLATLAYEVLLTRIFSVTMWYHLAFLAISIAMFGMTLGALRVYLQPARYPKEQTERAMGWSALRTGLFMVTGVAAHIALGPVLGDRPLLGLTGTFIAIAVPFYESGVCVCLALTRFPRQTSRLYGADLAGAAAGCLLVIALLHWFDAVAAVVVVALLPGVAAWCFAAKEHRALRSAAAGSCLLLVTVVAGHEVLAARSASPLHITWTKGRLEDKAAYEKWNSFSRLAVRPLTRDGTPLSWSLSQTYEQHAPAPLYYTLNIDSVAGTMLTQFDGDLSRVDYLKYDVSNLVHYLRPAGKVVVVGVGGGTDILSAAVFGQKEVTGVEMNEDVLRILTERYGDFTGHLDRLPQVRFVNQEGRSYAAAGGDPADVVQLTFIDTWAATAAGAFVLSENALYTRESWKLFLERLKPDGILSVSRGFESEPPYEIYRLTALARESLRALGVEKPENNIVVVANLTPKAHVSWCKMAVVLVSRTAFSAADLDTLEDVTRRLQFDVMWSPRQTRPDAFRQMATDTDVAALEDRLGMTFSAPTDDAPFFFQMLRPRDFLRRSPISDPYGRPSPATDPNQRAVGMLFGLLGVVTVLTVLCIVVPLAWAARGKSAAGAAPCLVYIACIGLGFMLIEISQMQRLILFLGHPVYGLSVILFALLLAGGLGSYLTDRIADASFGRLAPRCLMALVGVMVIFGFASVPALNAWQHGSMLVRLTVALAILFPLGGVMGTAFPLGIRLANARVPQATPWLWGVNGAASVMASVLAMAVALTFGISVSYWAGVACYAVAGVALVMGVRATSEALRAVPASAGPMLR